jgi:hypothetical protein
VEHVERQEEREQEIRSSADELEEQGDKLEERGAEVDQKIDEARDDWEQKQGSTGAPGAQDGDGTGLTRESPDGEDDHPEPRPEEDE